MAKLADENAVAEANDAMARQAWDEAYAVLSEADRSHQLDPERLALLADAAYLAGHPEASGHAWERVHAVRLAAGDREGAAEAGARVAGVLLEAGLMSPLRGWVRRARTLLEGLPDSPVHGALAVVMTWAAVISGDGEGALAEARRALDVGTRCEDPAMRALALNGEGRALILLGQVEEGLALLDESTVAAMSGELDAMSTAILYCSTVCALQALAEFDRAEEWTQVMERWCTSHPVGPFRGYCRVHHAEILRLRGAWPDAEHEARLACDEVRPFARIDMGWPLTELGLIRLRMGNLPEAERAFLDAHVHGWDPQPGLALLRLAQGNLEAAAADIRDSLDHPSQVISWERPPNSELRRAPLLAAQVEIAVAVGDLERARWAADELDRIGPSVGTKAIRASAATARGTVLLADGDVEAAKQRLDGSARLWQEVGAPYESARARMGLAAAYRMAGNEERALAEFRAARSTFQRLGATLEVRRAAEALGEAEPSDDRVAARVEKVFMFTDIVRSTNLVEAIGDEAWRHLVRWHNQKLASLVGTHSGEVVRTMGDGFFVAFDTAKDALGCAVAVQRALAEHRREQGFSPQVRIGVHRAEATPEGRDWSGKGVHAAARIGALAEGEQILASRETAEAGGGRFPLSEPRVVSLRGISSPIEIVAIDWRLVVG